MSHFQWGYLSIYSACLKNSVAATLVGLLIPISVMGAWLYLRVRMKRQAGKTAAQN